MTYLYPSWLAQGCSLNARPLLGNIGLVRWKMLLEPWRRFVSIRDDPRFVRNHRELWRRCENTQEMWRISRGKFGARTLASVAWSANMGSERR